MRLHTIAGACMLALGTSSAWAQADGGFTKSTWVGPVETTTQQTLTDARSVSYGDFPGCGPGGCLITGAYAFNSFAGDAGALSLSLATQVGTLSPVESASLQNWVYLSNRFTVGGPDLEPGDRVMLTLTLRLDGAIDVHPFGNLQGLAALGVVQGAVVPRPQAVAPGPDGDEFEQRVLAGLTASWHVNASSGPQRGETGWRAATGWTYDSSGYGPGSYYGSCQPGDALCGYEALNGGVDAFDNPLPVTATLDTGTVTLPFEARVGQVYSVFGYLGTDVAEVGPLGPHGEEASVRSDFGHTLGFAVAAGPGASVTWEIAPPPVPEPPVWLLGLAGAALLLARRRRLSAASARG